MQQGGTPWTHRSTAPPASAYTHAGGSHAQYREYLSKDYLEDSHACVDKNPFKDLKDDRRARNWDSEIRWAEQEADGVIVEAIFRYGASVLPKFRALRSAATARGLPAST